MKLYNHQKAILEQYPLKYLLCWDTGTGKTVAALELAAKAPYSTIIVVPKALVEKWRRDIEEWSPGAESTIVGEREVHVKLLNGKIFTIISKEQFKNTWETLEPRASIVVDEAHYFFGTKSQLSKALIKYIKKHDIQYIWLCTATPYMSTPWNIYRAAQILGTDWNYWKFRDKFFYMRKMNQSNPHDKRMISVVKPNIEDDVAALVDRIGNAIHITECADVPEQIDITEYFKPTKQQERAIEELKDSEFNPIVRYTKIHQIENGAMKGDEFSPNEFYSNDKLDRIKELAKEHGKIAFFCRYNLQIDQIAVALEKNDKEVFIIRGDTKNRDEITRQVEKSDSCIVLINAACSEGYELATVGICVFASLSFSYVAYKQARGRFLRINKLKKNIYIHLVCSGVDEAVYKSILKKSDFDVAIYSKRVVECGNS